MKKVYEMQPITGTAVQTLPQQWTEAISGQISGTKESAYALAETSAFRDMLRAGLAKQAMDNTAVLAKFEEYYNSIAPSGSAEYRYIVQEYAKAAMAHIIGGGRE